MMALGDFRVPEERSYRPATPIAMQSIRCGGPSGNVNAGSHIMAVFIVNKEGQPVGIQLDGIVDPLAIKEVEEAIAQWRFTPATVNQCPTLSVVRVSVILQDATS